MQNFLIYYTFMAIRDYRNIKEGLEEPPIRRLRLPQTPRLMEELYEAEDTIRFPSQIPEHPTPRFHRSPLQETLQGLPPRAQLLCLYIAYEMTLECTPAYCWEGANGDFMEQYAVPKMEALRAYLDYEITEVEYSRRLWQIDQETPSYVWNNAGQLCRGFLWILGSFAQHGVSYGSIGGQVEHTLRQCAPQLASGDMNPAFPDIIEEWVARCRARLAFEYPERLELWNPEEPAEIQIFGQWDPEKTYDWPEEIRAEFEMQDINREARQEAREEGRLSEHRIEELSPRRVASNISVNELSDGVYEGEMYGVPVKIFLWSPSHMDRAGMVLSEYDDYIPYAEEIVRRTS